MAYSGRTYYCWCGQPLEQQQRGRIRRYCSDYHRIRAYKARQLRPLGTDAPDWAKHIIEWDNRIKGRRK